MFSWANKHFATLAETLAPPPVDPTTGTTSASHFFLTALNSGGSSGEMEALAIIRTNFNNGSFDPRMSLNVRGMTALHVASTKCAASIIRELLTNSDIYGIDVNSTDSEGNTALHAAASAGSGTGGIDPNQSLAIVKLLVEEYTANVLWKNYNGCTPYDMARSQTVRGYLLPKQLQAEAALGGIMGDAAAATHTSLVNNAGPPPTSISTTNINNHGVGEEEEEVYDPVAALMRPTVGALGNVRSCTSVPSLSTSTTTTMSTMMSSTLSSPMMIQTSTFHPQHQDQEQEMLQPTSDDDTATAVVYPSSSSSSSSLADGWIECIDQNTSAVYYYNSITGVSSWDHPSSSLFAGGDDTKYHRTETIDTNLPKDELPVGWIECIDPANNSMVYYYNETTGVSQWDRPTTTTDDTPNNNEGADNVNWDKLQKDTAAVTVTDDITNDIDNIAVEDIVLTNENDVKVAETVADVSIQLFSHSSNECFEQPAILSATTTALMSSFGDDDDDDNVVSPPPLDTTCNPSLYHQPSPTEEEMQPPHQGIHDSSTSTTPSIIVADKQKQNLPVKTLFAITPPFVSVSTPKQQQQLFRPLLNAPSSVNTDIGGRGGEGSTTTSTTTSTMAATTRLQQSSGGGYALRGGHANAAAAILSSTSAAPMSGGSAGSATRPRIIYKPDGFHSSSNDRELQLKYGHVANEHDQQRLASIGPPPTSLGGSSSTQQGVGVGGTTLPPAVGGGANNPYSASSSSSSSSSRYPSAPSSFGGYDPNHRGVGAGASVVPAYATFQSPPPRND